jgi:hypothetical protein
VKLPFFLSLLRAAHEAQKQKAKEDLPSIAPHLCQSVLALQSLERALLVSAFSIFTEIDL